MSLHRALGEAKIRGDLCVGLSGPEPTQHLPLPTGEQALDPAPLLGIRLGSLTHPGEPGPQDPVTVGDQLDGRDEVCRCDRLGDEAGRAVAQCVQHADIVGIAGQHQEPRSVASSPWGGEQVQAVPPPEPDVEQDHLWLGPTDQILRLGEVVRMAHHLDPGAVGAQHPTQVGADQLLVVDDGDPDHDDPR